MVFLWFSCPNSWPRWTVNPTNGDRLLRLPEGARAQEGHAQGRLRSWFDEGWGIPRLDSMLPSGNDSQFAAKNNHFDGKFNYL